MLLLAENFTLKVLTRLAHKVLGISKLKYIWQFLTIFIFINKLRFCYHKYIKIFYGYPKFQCYRHTSGLSLPSFCSLLHNIHHRFRQHYSNNIAKHNEVRWHTLYVICAHSFVVVFCTLFLLSVYLSVCLYVCLSLSPDMISTLCLK